MSTDKFHPQTEGWNFFVFFFSPKIHKTWTIIKWRDFFFILAIIIFSLFIYSVCDQEVNILFRFSTQKIYAVCCKDSTSSLFSCVIYWWFCFYIAYLQNSKTVTASCKSILYIINHPGISSVEYARTGISRILKLVNLIRSNLRIVSVQLPIMGGLCYREIAATITTTFDRDRDQMSRHSAASERAPAIIN